AHLEAGGHVLAPRGIYAETAKLLRTHFERFGVRFDFVDMTDLAAVEAALGADTRVVWCETPANPTLAVYDIAALAERARSVGAALVVDSTFATPYHQHPLELGADLVVHSATKGIGGHGDALGGVAVGSREKVDAVRSVAVRAAGGVLAPHNAWMLSRGLRTLGLRMERSSANAQELAQRLEADERIARVFYPGLASHPQHSVAARQMKRGFGALVAFELVGGLPAGRRAYDAFEVLTRAVSLGDLRTLVSHPASTTHFSMPAAQRAAAGISDGLFRMSVGVEDVEDLWEDLDRAMGAAARP
ncbi:MAG TPA: aminotransferase class I/II-fold pyridoxal phosphate-dependent enzyme, partial [Polyangiaceae bacterium LLY-WYZ-15_(1-7)]|nr:aminotransferase class I/II-fold pyridoxal phosphate-dependent enzyme [Polyangiaceae bacterium LLY-WYZ-15_(1-7)]